MAVQTRRPGGGWSQVTSWGSYGNTIANYASAIATAQEQQALTEIEAKVFAYKQGQLSYADLASFLNSRLSTYQVGSQKELDMRKLLVEVDNYETDKNRDIEETKLEAQYAKGGVSANERLAIEKQLLRFYKEGTPEYSNQLYKIAAAQELATQENKNIRIAKLQSELSKDGITTSEKIGLYKEAQSLTDKNSEEYYKLQEQIMTLDKQRKEEDRVKNINEASIAMLEKFKSGGITDEEALTMNREIQKMVDPESEDMLKLKQQEADLLGNISESGKTGSDKAERAEMERELLMQRQAISDLDQQFEQGLIPVNDYMRKKEGLLSLFQPQDAEELLTPEDYSKLKFETQKFLEQKNLVDAGQAAVVKTANKEFGRGVDIIPLDQMFKGSDSMTVYDEGDADTKSNPMSGRVVTMVAADGSEKQYVVTEKSDGTYDLQEVKEVRSGIDPATGMNTRYAVTSKGSGVVNSSRINEVLGYQRVVTPTVTTAPSSQLFSISSTPSSSPNERSSSPSNRSASSSVKTSKVKVSTPKITIPQVTTMAKAAVGKVSPSRSGQTGAKIGPVRVTRGILGTPDVGVTEKLGVGKYVSKTISAITNLFRRK